MPAPAAAYVVFAVVGVFATGYVFKEVRSFRLRVPPLAVNGVTIEPHALVCL